ncbi:NAD(P)-binding protein, partial [Aureobasidium melanogenum]
MEDIRRYQSNNDELNETAQAPSPAVRPSPTTSGSTGLAKLSLPHTTDPPSTSNPPRQKVWLVFGATGHMGRSVTKTALSHGDMVSAVGQLYQDTPASMKKWWRDDPDRYLGLLCDVRIRETVARVIDETIKHFGRIDIVANCAGYGVIGACEDQDEHEVRNQFETNFMGTLNIIQLSLPYFRNRNQIQDRNNHARHGHYGHASSGGRYLIFSSTSGALGVPGLGPYCATKYAVEGLIESILYEVDHFGIRATLVEPGHVRRDDNHEEDDGYDHDMGNTSTINTKTLNSNNHSKLTDSASASAPGAQPVQRTTTKRQPLPIFGHFKIAKPSEPYAAKDSPAAHTQRTLQWIGDNQPTSVVRAAELVWQLGHCRYPPLRLLLGSFAVDSIRDRLKCIIEEIEDWKHLNFPPLEGHDEEDDVDDEDNAEGEEDGGGRGGDSGRDEEQDQEQEHEALDTSTAHPGPSAAAQGAAKLDNTADSNDQADTGAGGTSDHHQQPPPLEAKGKGGESQQSTTIIKHEQEQQEAMDLDD